MVSRAARPSIVFRNLTLHDAGLHDIGVVG